MSTRYIALALTAIVAAFAGHVFGFKSATEYYKTLFKTSYTSNDPAEAEKAEKTLCRLLHLKVQYPDEN